MARSWNTDRVDVALATLVRLLKPGGTIVWTTPFLMQYHANPGDENRYSPTRVNALFDRAGLDTVKSDGVGNWLAVTLYLAGFGTDETHSSELDAPDRDGSRPYWIDVIAVGRKRTSSLDSRAMPTAETPALSLEAALRRVQPGSNRRAWKSMVAPARICSISTNLCCTIFPWRSTLLMVPLLSVVCGGVGPP